MGLLIGELSRRAGVPVSTVRFYERNGLLEMPERRESGYREYPDATVERLAFIRHAQDLGFTLQQIKALLALRANPEAHSDVVRDEAVRCLSDIREKLDALTAMEVSLSRVLSCCDGKEPVEKCPIMMELHTSRRGSYDSQSRSVHRRMRRL